MGAVIREKSMKIPARVSDSSFVLGSPMSGGSTSTTGTINSLRNLRCFKPDGRLQGVVELQLSVPFANGCN